MLLNKSQGRTCDVMLTTKKKDKKFDFQLKKVYKNVIY